MSRKKTAKGTAKHQSNSLPAIQKVEKELIQIPYKLAAQLSKEIKSLKQKEAKLKNTIAKIKSQLSNAENRVKAAEKNKNKAAGKKQLSIAKKNLSEIKKAFSLLAKEQQETAKSLLTMTAEQAKLNALHKHLNQFEKEWAKQVKQAKAKVKVKVTKTKSKKRSNQSTLPSIKEEPRVETFDTIEEDITTNETAEVTS